MKKNLLLFILILNIVRGGGQTIEHDYGENYLFFLDARTQFSYDGIISNLSSVSNTRLFSSNGIISPLNDIYFDSVFRDNYNKPCVHNIHRIFSKGYANNEFSVSYRTQVESANYEHTFSFPNSVSGTRVIRFMDNFFTNPVLYRTYLAAFPFYEVNGLPERYNKTGNDLKVNINTRDGHAYSSGVCQDNIGISTAVKGYKFSIQVKLATESDAYYRTLTLYENCFDFSITSISCTYAAISSAFGYTDFIGKECILRIKQDVGKHVFYSNSKSFFYLDEAPVSINYTSPVTCVGDSTNATISIGDLSNFKDEPGLQYLYLFYEYTDIYEDRCSGCNVKPEDVEIIHPSIPSAKLYIKKVLTALTQNTTFGSQTIPYKLPKGFYKVKAYLLYNAVMYYPKELVVEIKDPDPFIVSLGYPKTFGSFNIGTCDDKGTLSASFTNGMPPFSFKALGQNQGSLISNGNILLPSGSYPVTITDANNCIASVTGIAGNINFTKPDPITVNTSSAFASQLTCYQSDDGSISVQVTGGIKDYSRVWIDDRSYPFNYNSSVLTITNLPANNYHRINIRDTSGCRSSDFIIDVPVGQPSPLSITSVNYKNPSCSGDLPSINNIITTGGNSGHEYWTRKNDWTSVALGSPDFNSQDTVTIFLKDSKGCIYKHPLQTMPAVPGPIRLNTTLNQPVTCNAAFNGRITLGISGGTTADNKYSTIFNSLPQIKTNLLDQDNLSAGNYQISIQDDNLCRKDTTITVGLTANKLRISSLLTSPASCETVLDGQLTLGINPGERAYEPYFYSIEGPIDLAKNPATNSENINSLPNGNYNIRIGDAANCFRDSFFTIGLDPARLKKPVLSGQNTVCPGVSLGSITGNIIDGYPITGNFLIKLYDSNNILKDTQNSSSINFDNLGVGTYSVLVKDAKGCETSETVPVNSNPTPVHFQYIDSSYQYCDEVENGMIKITGTTKPTHTITAMINATGAFDVPISNNALAEINSIPAGIYKIRAVDNAGCLNDTSVLILNIHNDPKISIRILDSLACESAQNGIIRVSATQNKTTGNFNYNLVGNDLKTDSLVAHFKNLTLHRNPGKYALNVTDMIGCGSDTTFEFLPIKNPVKISKFSFDTASCIRARNAAINLEASGSLESNPGYFYVLNNKDTLKGSVCSFVDQKPGGINKVILYDNYGCFDNTPVFAFPVKSDSLNIEMVGWINPACPDQTTGSISIHAFNGKQFADGFNYSVFKNNESLPVKTTRGPSDCKLTGLAKGNFYVEVTDKDNCRAFTSEITLTDPDTIDLNVFPGYIAAKGASTGWINAEASGGNGKYVVEWYAQGSVNPANKLLAEETLLKSGIKNIAAGYYLVRVRDTASCKFWGTEWFERVVRVPEPDKVLALTAVKKQVSCNGMSDGVFTLTGTGGWGTEYQYGSTLSQITQVSPIFANISRGSYTYYAKDTSGTVTNIMVEMTEPELLTASVDKIDHARCYGSSDGKVMLFVNGGNKKYQVSNDNAHWVPGVVYSGLGRGSYTFFVRDSLNCVTQVSAMITQPGQIVAADTTIFDTQCQVREGSVETRIEGGTPGYTYHWSDDAGNIYTGSAKIDSLYSGQYLLRVTDANDCPAEFTFYVSDVTDLEIDTIIPKPVSCWNGSDGSASVIIRKGFPPYSISWPGDVKGTSVPGLSSGNYLLKVSDSEGCKVFRGFSIASPDSLWLDINRLSHPLCYGVMDGLLDVAANGGTPSYEYLWNTGRSRANVSNLDSGVYTVLVTDKNNCQKIFKYHLTYQERIHSSLPKQLTICKANSYPVKPGNFNIYNWKKDGVNVPGDSVIYVSAPGLYTLRFQDFRGCKATDSIKIVQTENALKAQFLMASAIRQNDTLIVFEASDPLPDSIVIFPATGLKEVKSEKFYKYFVATDTGKFDLTLISYSHGCQDIITKQVLVLPPGVNPDNSIPGNSKIVKFFAYPNPTDGNFQVEVRTTDKADIHLRLVSFGTGKTEAIRLLKGDQNYMESFNMEHLQSGFYLLNLQVDEEMRNIKLIIR